QCDREFSRLQGAVRRGRADAADTGLGAFEPQRIERVELRTAKRHYSILSKWFISMVRPTLAEFIFSLRRRSRHATWPRGPRPPSRALPRQTRGQPRVPREH